MPFDYDDELNDDILTITDDDFESPHEHNSDYEPHPELEPSPGTHDMSDDDIPYDDLEDDSDFDNSSSEEDPHMDFSAAIDDTLPFNRDDKSSQTTQDENTKEESVGILKRILYAVLNSTLQVASFIGRTVHSFLFGDVRAYSWTDDHKYSNLKRDAKKERRQRAKERKVAEQQDKKEETPSKTEKSTQHPNQRVAFMEKLLQDSGLKVRLTDHDDYACTLPNSHIMILKSDRFDNAFYEKLAVTFTLMHHTSAEKLTDLDKLYGALRASFLRYAALVSNVRPEDAETHLNTKLTVLTADIHSCIKMEREPVYHNNVLSSYHVNVLYNNTVVGSFPEKDLQDMIKNPEIIEKDIYPFLNEQYQDSLSTDHCIQNNQQKIFFHKTGSTQVSISVLNNPEQPVEQVGTFNIEAKSDIHNITQALYQHGCSDLDLVTTSHELGAEVIATTIAYTVNPAMTTGFNALDNTEYEPLLDQYVASKAPYINVQYHPHAYEFYETAYQNNQFADGSKIAFISSFGSMQDKHIQQMAESLQAEAMHIRDYLSYEQEEQQREDIVYRSFPTPASSVFQTTVEEYMVANTINNLYTQSLDNPLFAMDNRDKETEFDLTDIDHLPLVMMPDEEYESQPESPELEDAITQENQPDIMEPDDILEFE